MGHLQEILEKAAPAGETSALTSEPELDGKELVQLLCDAYNAMPGDLDKHDGHHCDVCNNKGFISVPFLDDRGHWQEQSVFCKCRKTRRSLRRLKRSGLGKMIHEYTFEKYQATEEWQKVVKDAALRFVQDDAHTWFFIGGASGAGKSHICTAIAAHYLGQEKEVNYMLWRDDVVKLKANVTDSEIYNQIMHEFKTVEVLYIDDLFKTGKANDGTTQRPTAADINIAFELLNYRYNNPDLVTIISSECRTPDILNIDEAVGGRIVERTLPYGYGINIKPDRSKNYRLKGAIEL